MKRSALVGAFIVAFIALGCDNKKKACIAGCEKTFFTKVNVCTAPGQGDRETCRQTALEGRHSCRKGCGVEEPMPAFTSPLPKAAESGKPTGTNQ
ncbi:MAG: hypothetical protein IPK82_00795 [Polyangiaceae bacterium]|nr:hypothetical protein [Polyangiaceae bacterium]